MDVPTKRFARFDVPRMTAYGAGAFTWQKGPHPRLILLIPRGDGKFECAKLNVKGWGYSCGDHGWDGNFDSPTITGSIPGETWHGWLRDGVLTEEPPE